MREMYKTKATKAWQALERIIHLFEVCNFS